jgi:hypothetical protein
MEKPDAKFFLQVPDLTGEGRLGRVQFFGGFGEAQRFRHADEVAQMTKFHRPKKLSETGRHVNSKKRG